MRVINITAIVFYLICCLPLNCCPESSICYKFLNSDEINIEVMDHLAANQWIFNENAMKSKVGVKCLLCLHNLKHGDTIWYLPCPPVKRYRSNAGSTFGGTMTTQTINSSDYKKNAVPKEWNQNLFAAD